jgi:hypothetical protein
MNLICAVNLQISLLLPSIFTASPNPLSLFGSAKLQLLFYSTKRKQEKNKSFCKLFRKTLIYTTITNNKKMKMFEKL